MALDDSYSYSVSPELMRAVAQIESGGDPNAVTGSYKGLYQLSEPEFQRYGGKNIFDPEENTRVATMKIQAEANQLAKALGRPVTDADVYLAHQQGVGGATSHLSNPDQPAWQSMAQTAEGRQKGEEWAKRAIWGNIPDQQKAQFGDVNNVTSGQFAGLWQARLARAMGQPATAQPAPAATAAVPMAPASGLLASAQGGLLGGAQPQSAPQESGGILAPPPAEHPMQLAQIQYAQRRQPDLSKLKALFKAPTFSRG
jgi:hypothetical protein